MLRKIEEKARMETLLAILEGVDDAIVVADKDKKFLAWNQSATDILRLGPTDNPNWSRYYGCYQADGVTFCEEENLPLVQAINGVRVDKQIMFLKNDQMDHGVWVKVTAIPLSFGGVVVFRDITESQRACIGLQKIIEGHKETLAVEVPDAPPVAAPQTVVVKIEVPASVAVTTENK